MKIIENLLTKNDCFKAGRKIAVKGLMLHSVGCSQPKASAFMNQWNKPGVQVCVHGFIQPDGTVYQCLPWNHRGWHGGGSSNNTHIGVEMTEPSTISYTNGANFVDNNPAATKAHLLATYAVAVDLFAHLCKQFGLNPLADGVIISHKEGCARGVASNHGDPEHLWGKFGLTMNGFRNAVNAAMRGASDKPTTDTGNGTNGAQGGTVAAYRVRITANDLNIRKGAGTNYEIAGAIKDKGVYTIVAESPGKGATKWGKLKSGAGWISLDFTKKL